MSEVPLYASTFDGPTLVDSTAKLPPLGVRETQILVEQQSPKGVFIGDHAGLVINTFSGSLWRQMPSSSLRMKKVRRTEGPVPNSAMRTSDTSTSHLRRGARDNDGYRGTSLIRKHHFPGPYSRTMPRLLWWF